LHLIKIEREWSAKNREFPIIFLGDLHVGSAHCDYELLKEHVQKIADTPNAIVFLMGDTAEYILPNNNDKRWRASSIDKRFWPYMDALTPAYTRYLVELLTPIAHMIQVVHEGGHEAKMFPVMDPAGELAGLLRREVEKKYGPEKSMDCLHYAPGSAMTKVQWKLKSDSDYRSIIINSAHGYRAGRKEGAKHNNMIDMFTWCDADIIVRGHSHSLFMNPGPVRLGPNPTMTKLVKRQTFYGQTGSYLKTIEVSDYPCYAEKAEYPPLPMGNSQVHVYVENDGLNMSPYVQM
jgi:hypothetical protein